MKIIDFIFLTSILLSIIVYFIYICYNDYEIREMFETDTKKYNYKQIKFVDNETNKILGKFPENTIFNDNNIVKLERGFRGQKGDIGPKGDRGPKGERGPIGISIRALKVNGVL